MHPRQMSIGSQIVLRHSFDVEALLELVADASATQRVDMMERSGCVSDRADDEAGEAVVDDLGDGAVAESESARALPRNCAFWLSSISPTNSTFGLAATIGAMTSRQ